MSTQQWPCQFPSCQYAHVLLVYVPFSELEDQQKVLKEADGEKARCLPDLPVPPPPRKGHAACEVQSALRRPLLSLFKVFVPPPLWSMISETVTCKWSLKLRQPHLILKGTWPAVLSTNEQELWNDVTLLTVFCLGTCKDLVKQSLNLSDMFLLY